MPTAPFIQPITSKAARAILRDHRTTLQEFNRTGRLDISVDVRLTKTGRCQWQIIDMSNVDGRNLVPLLSLEQQQQLPAFDVAAPTFAENNSDRDEAARHHRNLCELRRV